jgi:hypothetical protein
MRRLCDCVPPLTLMSASPPLGTPARRRVDLWAERAQLEAFLGDPSPLGPCAGLVADMRVLGLRCPGYCKPA